MSKIPSLLLFLIFLAASSCDDEDSDDEVINTVALESEINEFVWSAMNTWYIWQDEVDILADDAFEDQDSYFTFLNGFATPEDLFYDGLLSPKDRFSIIVDDYDTLLGTFASISLTDGIEYVLVRPPEGGTAIVGVVMYVLPGSDGEIKGVERGDIFYAINGEELFAITDANGFITSSNLDLLDASSYTMNFADIINNQTVPNGVNIDIVKTLLEENPILIAKTLDVSGSKIGYIMYNDFIGDYDDELNAAFGRLAADGATELVLDLRYNPGGLVQSSLRLASMVTGQFTNQVFATEEWNSKWQPLLGRDILFTDNINGEPINGLNLNRVYVITTGDTASASELTMNSLEPYIDVIQIGDVTVGKNEFSSILLDDDDQTLDGIAFPYIFLEDVTLDNVDPDHRYALSPLMGTYTNAEGFGEFTDGLQPDILQRESLLNLGTLGEPDEPLLSIAIQEITGSVAKSTLTEVPENMEINIISSSNRRKPYSDILFNDVPSFVQPQ